MNLPILEALNTIQRIAKDTGILLIKCLDKDDIRLLKNLFPEKEVGGSDL